MSCFEDHQHDPVVCAGPGHPDILERSEVDELAQYRRTLKQGGPGQLGTDATREARDALVAWLRQRAEFEANGSRDFGRGFSHAIRVLEAAPATCACCELPEQALVGQWVSCFDCGKRWRKGEGAFWTSRDSDPV